MKDRNKKIRWILIQAANTAARKDDRLRRFYLRIAKRHGHHIAITHVANKMITIPPFKKESSFEDPVVLFRRFFLLSKICSVNVVPPAPRFRHVVMNL